MKVFDRSTQQRQENYIDGKNLISYPGGCTRGELTKLGQRQVRALAAEMCSQLHDTAQAHIIWLRH